MAAVGRPRRPPKRAARSLDPGRVLEHALVGERTRQAGDVLDAAGQPVLVLEDREDDLGDAEGGDGEVVGAQAERELADEVGGPRGEEAADRPGDQHRQAEAAEVAGGGRVDRLDRLGGGVEEDAHQEVADGDGQEPEQAAEVGRARARGRRAPRRRCRR